jgi:hypothetical protein
LGVDSAVQIHFPSKADAAEFGRIRRKIIRVTVFDIVWIFKRQLFFGTDFTDYAVMTKKQERQGHFWHGFHGWHGYCLSFLQKSGV